jgi:hypothetical protein
MPRSKSISTRRTVQGGSRSQSGRIRERAIGALRERWRSSQTSGRLEGKSILDLTSVAHFTRGFEAETLVERSRASWFRDGADLYIVERPDRSRVADQELNCLRAVATTLVIAIDHQPPQADDGRLAVVVEHGEPDDNVIGKHREGPRLRSHVRLRERDRVRRHEAFLAISNG